jgi:predicted XRE-type DNA-binding protein
VIVILAPCRRELERFPEPVRIDLADALARLDEGHLLAMPLSRPMSALGKGVHELRLRDTSMTKKKKTSPASLAKALCIPRTRATQAVMKAELISALIREVQRQEITHAELARRSDLSRTTVTGILTGSLQKVTIDRLLRLVEAAGLEARIRIRRAA